MNYKCTNSHENQKRRKVFHVFLAFFGEKILNVKNEGREGPRRSLAVDGKLRNCKAFLVVGFPFTSKAKLQLQPLTSSGFTAKCFTFHITKSFIKCFFYYFFSYKYWENRHYSVKYFLLLYFFSFFHSRFCFCCPSFVSLSLAEKNLKQFAAFFYFDDSFDRDLNLKTFFPRDFLLF